MVLKMKKIQFFISLVFIFLSTSVYAESNILKNTPIIYAGVDLNTNLLLKPTEIVDRFRPEDQEISLTTDEIKVATYAILQINLYGLYLSGVSDIKDENLMIRYGKEFFSAIKPEIYSTLKDADEFKSYPVYLEAFNLLKKYINQSKSKVENIIYVHDYLLDYIETRPIDVRRNYDNDNFFYLTDAYHMFEPDYYGRTVATKRINLYAPQTLFHDTYVKFGGLDRSSLYNKSGQIIDWTDAVIVFRTGDTLAKFTRDRFTKVKYEDATFNWKLHIKLYAQVIKSRIKFSDEMSLSSYLIRAPTDDLILEHIKTVVIDLVTQKKIIADSKDYNGDLPYWDFK
jgi:hypothetical protein